MNRREFITLLGGAAAGDAGGGISPQFALQPDVILAQGTPVIAALKRETRTIPIACRRAFE